MDLAWSHDRIRQAGPRRRRPGNLVGRRSGPEQTPVSCGGLTEAGKVLSPENPRGLQARGSLHDSQLLVEGDRHGGCGRQTFRFARR